MEKKTLLYKFIELASDSFLLVQQPVSNANNVARIYFRKQGEQAQA
jgi:hypothetical protein